MAFFEGLDGSSARSDLAEEIGYQGLAFVEDWWSWSDQQAYVRLLLLHRISTPSFSADWLTICCSLLGQVLLLILELGRAMADDRAAATFGE